jgi:hypothetical protein
MCRLQWRWWTASLLGVSQSLLFLLSVTWEGRGRTGNRWSHYKKNDCWTWRKCVHSGLEECRTPPSVDMWLQFDFPRLSVSSNFASIYNEALQYGGAIDVWRILKPCIYTLLRNLESIRQNSQSAFYMKALIFKNLQSVNNLKWQTFQQFISIII